MAKVPWQPNSELSIWSKSMSKSWPRLQSWVWSALQDVMKRQGSDAHDLVEGPGRGLPEGRGASPARKESKSDAVRREVLKMRIFC